MNPSVARSWEVCKEGFLHSKFNRNFLLLLWYVAFSVSALADTPAPPSITNFSSTGTQRILKWTPYPAAKSYTIFSSTNVNGTFTTNNGTIAGYTWTGTSTAPANFYQLRITPLSSNELFTANVLNRLAYGPTPDDLDRILNPTNGIGPDAYIAEQLAPETITETVGNSHTNVNILTAKLSTATDIVVTNIAYAKIDDFRALHILRAVGAKRQLLEILLQFFENHFVTQYTKSYDYFNQYYDDANQLSRIATQLEYLENDKWRTALLNPTCTFYDMLKISAESPAMIIYLDTVTSKGNGATVANENYARELMELFTMGVDNGYVQNDITIMSHYWTGWTLQIVDPTNATNPFAARTTNNIAGVTNNFTTVSNLAGVWAFNYVKGSHTTTNKMLLFTNAIVPGRFGAPYTTRTYGTNAFPGQYTFNVTNDTTTNGIQDGYKILSFLANLPFTQEFISVKLCRLFVHDDFDIGYDFRTNTSPEALLVRQCMTAWDANGGQIRPVLSTIFNSDLFRSHGGSMQKVKTPLEYTVSAIRALRCSTNQTFLANSFSSDTDGYNIITANSTLDSVLNRMGAMSLFDRAAPDGYSEDAAYWVSAGTLAERIRFVQTLSIAPGQVGHNGNATNDVGVNTYLNSVALLKTKLPAASLTNAPAVVDYLLGIIYPGEGAGNLNLYRTAGINFLNDGTADPTPSSTLFANLAVSGTANTAYDNRVRGLVALMLSYQRFHEQ